MHFDFPPINLFGPIFLLFSYESWFWSSKWILKTNSDFINERTHLLLKDLGPVSLFWQSQQEVVADHVALHCGVFAPCLTDDITGPSVMGGYWDHENQEWSFLSTSVWLVHYETIWVWVCRKELHRLKCIGYRSILQLKKMITGKKLDLYTMQGNIRTLVGTIDLI